MLELGFLVVAAVGAPDANTLESLRALGYVDSAPTSNPEERGVTLLREPAYPGMNLLSSRHKATAHLVDMQGEIHHSWQDPGAGQWMHVELQPDGDILALTKDAFLTRLDSDSRVVWRLRTRVHHDFTVASDGRILALSRRIAHKTFRGMGKMPVLEDTLVWVSPRGEIISEHSVFDRVRHFVSKNRIQSLHRAVKRRKPWKKIARPEYEGDLTHTNSVEILDLPVAGVAPAGSILLSMRELNRIAILDAELTTVLWVWGGPKLQGQHHATQLDNGNILVFDNGVERRSSRVIEVDPASREMVWTYSNPELFTRLRGAAQMLPNGNVLVTESDSGHAIEVTRDRKIVWEFWNPEVRTDRGRTERDAIYRLLRYPPSYFAANE